LICCGAEDHVQAISHTSRGAYTVRHLTSVIALLGVQRITVPGGCAHCDSTQTIVTTGDPDRIHLYVDHDDGCVWTSGYWARYQSAGIGQLEAELQDNA
jgi:hypothetical protein